MVFRGYLKKGRESGGVRLDSVPYSLRDLRKSAARSSPYAVLRVSYMLVYKKNSNVLALLREAIECGFDVGVLRFRIHPP